MFRKSFYLCLALLFCLASSVYGEILIGNWEGTNLDSWGPAWEGNTVLVPGSTLGVTRGNSSLSVTTKGGYWCLIWYAPIIPAITDDAKFSFDLSMISSEWTDASWTEVGAEIALNGNGPSMWQEYGPDSTRGLGEVINRDTALPSTFDWSPSQGNVNKTYTYDISDYDISGATWFQMIITIEGGNGSGHFYFDNARFVPEPASMSLLALGPLALLRKKR